MTLQWLGFVLNQMVTSKTLIKEYNKLQNIILNFTNAINSLTRELKTMITKG